MMIVELLTDDTLFQDYYEKQETEQTGQKFVNNIQIKTSNMVKNVPFISVLIQHTWGTLQK